MPRRNRRRLRVLIEVNSGDLKIGATNDALDLAELLRPQGVSVCITGTTMPAFRAEATRRGINTDAWRSRMWSRRSLAVYAFDVVKWRTLLSWWRPDVVHLNYAGYGPSLACAAWQAGVPVVARAGGRYHPRDPANKWIAAYAANCRAHAESFTGTPLAERVVVTGDLFREQRLDATRIPVRPLPRRVDGVPRVLFLGQLVPRKGLDVLIAAAAQMQSHAQLVLVGGDWNLPGYPAQLREQIAAAGIADRVVLENHRPDVAALLADADVLVLPSLSEARPRTIIEAMLMGRPVVASAVGGVPDLVVHERTGLLCEPGDARGLAMALDRVVSSAEWRARFGANGREWAQEHCDPRRTCRAYLQLYERLTADQARSPRAAQRHCASS